MAVPVMVGSVPVRVISFLMFATCGALCQQHQQNPRGNSLPDAPSVQVPAQTEIFPAFANEERFSLTYGDIGSDAVLTAESEDANPNRAQISSGGFDKADPLEENPSHFFERYLYPSLLKRTPSYHPSTSGSLLGRATDAASRILVTRDDSGKQRFNASYLFGMLSSAAIHTAYRPYWRRSLSEPFSDFGSNLGNDAGMNLLHEFGPGIEQLMKSHAPKFVAKIEDRISHN